MAGLFGLFDFTKEGPGLEPEDLEKGAFAQFFSILGRRFWKLIMLNMMYLLLSLPVIVLSWFISSFLLWQVFPQFEPTALLERMATLQPDLSAEVRGQLVFFILLIAQILAVALSMGTALHVLGPVHAGMTFAYRNYARDRHVFLWMDFRETFKQNWKPALLTGAINFVAHFLLLFAISFYSRIALPAFISALLITILIIFGLLLVISNIYLWQMMITIDIPYKNLWKNAFIFALARLPFNLLLLLATGLIFVGLPLLFIFLLPSFELSLLLTLIWYFCFAFSLNWLLHNFYAHRVIDRFILSKIDGGSKVNVHTEGEELEADYDVKEVPQDDERDGALEPSRNPA